MKIHENSEPHKVKNISTKLFAVMLSLVLVVGGVIGGTVAWLVTQSSEVKNTFTTSNIDITLTETERDYKMIPGWTIDKDPKATVLEGSEDCYLFVKAEKSNDFDGFMTYEVADGWTKLASETDVYYRIFDSQDNSSSVVVQNYSILKDDKVSVKDTVTKEMMQGLSAETYPTLTFTAYAVQLYKSNTEQFTAAEAWGQIKPSSTTEETVE